MLLELYRQSITFPVEEIVKYDRYKTGKYKGDIRPKTAMYDISDAIALATFVYRRLNK